MSWSNDSFGDKRLPPSLSAENGRHSDSVRTRGEVMEGEEVATILRSKPLAT
jgi:hypothetical protein